MSDDSTNTFDANTLAGALSPAQMESAAGVEAGAGAEAIPAKFRREDGTLNQDALLASYLALESKGTDEEAPALEGAEPEAATEESGYIANPELSSALAEKGIDMTALNESFYEGGEELSEDWFDKLAEAGYSRGDVETYVAGVKATNESNRAAVGSDVESIYAVAGGQAGFESMLSHFASEGGSEHSERYNAAREAGDIAGMKGATADLYAEYRAAVGTEPGRRVGTVDSGVAPSGFRSFAEQKAAQTDPRYRKDPAYRAEVTTKIMNSKF
jgi:hypothetical protein